MELMRTVFRTPRYPDALVNATHSSAYLGSLFASRYPAATRDWVISELFEKGLGIVDAAEWEVDAVWKMRQDAYGANRALADAVSGSFFPVLPLVLPTSALTVC